MDLREHEIEFANEIALRVAIKIMGVDDTSPGGGGGEGVGLADQVLAAVAPEPDPSLEGPLMEAVRAAMDPESTLNVDSLLELLNGIVGKAEAQEAELTEMLAQSQKKEAELAEAMGESIVAIKGMKRYIEELETAATSMCDTTDICFSAVFQLRPMLADVVPMTVIVALRGVQQEADTLRKAVKKPVKVLGGK